MMKSQHEIKNLIDIKHRRLQKLREQKARIGINAPPELLNEIEDIEAEVDSLWSELQQTSENEERSLSKASETNLEGVQQRSLIFGSRRLPKGFLGREAELSDLLTALEDPDKTVFWIGGISGIGKTYFASQLYDQIGGTDYYTLLWVDCQIRSLTSEILIDALIDLSGDQSLLQLRQDPTVKSAERMEQVVRNFMEPKKVMLFLDNSHLLEGLDQPDRLDDLIIHVASQCRQTKLVLIGRARPSIFNSPELHGASLEFHLDKGLDVEYIKQFLDIPDLGDEQAHQIWEKCASGTPMALFVWKKALQRRSMSELLDLPIWSIADKKTQWVDLIFNDLTPSEFACVQAASVFPAHITLEALAYVYGEADLESAIEGLQDKGLLDHKPGSETWSVWHDIIKEYVNDTQITPGVRNELERRLAEFYSRFVLDNIQSSKVLQSEAANILGVIDWCRRKQQGESITVSALLQRLLELELLEVLPIILVFGNLAYRAGDRKSAEELYEETADLARLHENLPLLANALERLSYLAQSNYNNQLAISRLEEVIRVAQMAGEKANKTQANSYERLGGLLLAQGRSRYALAEQNLKDGLQIAKAGGYYLIAARIVNNLVFIYTYQDEFDKAYSLYHEERERLSGIALATLLVGMIPSLTAKGRFDEAWRLILEARSIFEQRNNLGGVAYTWRLEGQWCWKQDELEAAEDCFKKEEQMRRIVVEENVGEIYHLRQALWEQHVFFLGTNQLNKAEQVRSKYQEIQPEPDDLMPQMLGHEARVLVTRKAFQRASQRSEGALTMFQNQDNFGGCAWIKRIQGDILAAQGNFSGAEQLYKEGIDLRDRSDESKYTAEDLEHFAKFYLYLKKDIEQARAQLERAQHEYQLAGLQIPSTLAKISNDLPSK